MLRFALLTLALLGCHRDDADAAPAAQAARAPARARAHDVAAARDALDAGRPWRATEILAPALRDPRRRSPEVVLLAARAAAAWGGWDEVRRLLEPAAWLDSLDAGAGRVLLARAMLEQRHDSLGARHAGLALATARTAGERAERLVLLSRGLERVGRGDSARAGYERAAALLPDVADWLRLRAAALTADSAARAVYFASLGSAAARARTRWVDAAARERAGDLSGAASVYGALGAPVSAARARLAAVRDTATRRSVRRTLLAVVAERSATAEARAATELLDRAFAPLGRSEELAVARSAAVAGPAARAVRGFERALAVGPLGDRDRFTYATLLSRLGRDDEAAREFARVRSAPLVGRAAYQHARSLLRDGQGAAARTHLAATARIYAADTAAAAAALYLLGDLATDDGDDRGARARFRGLAERYPTSAQAPAAWFRAALIAHVSGDAAAAAREFDALADRYPASDDAAAARYWAGRAWSDAGDSASARGRWRAVMRRDPASYYAMLAARRLGAASWTPAPAAPAPAPAPEIAASMARARRLTQLGMAAEARHEYDRLARDAAGSVPRLLATAEAFAEAGLASRAIGLAQQALARDAAADVRTYRALYPMMARDVLRAESERHGVDAPLVAALVRQESSFEPRAVSRAGALGLMQLMPDVGKQLAAARQFAVWDRALLFQPDVNIQLGTAHLADLLRAHPHVAYALAAYNAGGSRVARWSAKRGAVDPEVFAERIPFAETRDYVRIVQRNRAIYDALYGADAP